MAPNTGLLLYYLYLLTSSMVEPTLRYTHRGPKESPRTLPRLISSNATSNTPTDAACAVQRPSIVGSKLADQTNNRVTNHFDVFKAGEDEVLQQLAADPSCSHHQHLAGGDGVSQLFSKGTHELDHVDGDRIRACSGGG